ncbi:MAG TPA: helix-turn-helix domain-containing protein [Bryobacteraceae bacterium]|jgi:transposase InsO family protein|nr:helix-turn-helix domain-containing protein [Silvibacterium sp.]HEX4594493.1 helix-turn-helix domain-containing protein [Bryobacteraceae bacterium]
MTDDDRNHEALFRHAILGDLLSRNLRRGQLRPALKQLAQQSYQDHHGRSRRVAYKTLEEWYYKYRNGGFEALRPRPRKDRNRSRVLAEDIQQLILDMKREDPGRSARLIVRELELAGRIRAGEVSRSVIQRLLRRHGLSVPRMELDHAARYRWEAAMCGELWQADALHGPALMNPATGRKQRVIVFGLIDDRSRLIPYLEGGFGETEQRFLAVLYQAMARRGIVRKLLLDNHASFSGYDLRLLCAKLGIHLVHSRPGDAPSKGKIERLWRTLRAQLIDRLDLERVTTLDEFNLRLWTWVEMEYHHQPHSSLSGRTPLEVWESEADQIHWIEDHSQLEQHFYGEVERLVRNDSTVQWRGVFYEVPPYLRRQKVRLRYALLDSTRVSVLDGETEIPLRRVQPVDNSHRSRLSLSTTVGASDTPKTGLNAAELILARAAGIDPHGGGDE